MCQYYHAHWMTPSVRQIIANPAYLSDQIVTVTTFKLILARPRKEVRSSNTFRYETGPIPVKRKFGLHETVTSWSAVRIRINSWRMEWALYLLLSKNLNWCTIVLFKRLSDPPPPPTHTHTVIHWHDTVTFIEAKQPLVNIVQRDKWRMNTFRNGYSCNHNVNENRRTLANRWLFFVQCFIPCALWWPACHLIYQTPIIRRNKKPNKNQYFITSDNEARLDDCPHFVLFVSWFSECLIRMFMYVHSFVLAQGPTVCEKHPTCARIEQRTIVTLDSSERSRSY